MKVFINGIRASFLDINALFQNLIKGKDGLKSVKRLRNEIHFETV